MKKTIFFVSALFLLAGCNGKNLQTSSFAEPESLNTASGSIVVPMETGSRNGLLENGSGYIVPAVKEEGGLLKSLGFGFSCGKKLEYAGQKYKTTKIGNQCWFGENLNVGTKIEAKASPEKNEKIEKFCYENDEKNCETMGALYTFDEALQQKINEGTQGICPPSWHIPTKQEIKILRDTLDPEAGNRIKSASACDEKSKAVCDAYKTSAKENPDFAKNVGFNLMLNGIRLPNGSSMESDTSGSFWSSTEAKDRDDGVVFYGFTTKKSQLLSFENVTNREEGRAVRCMRNELPE